jgi:hypothetical protein
MAGARHGRCASWPVRGDTANFSSQSGMNTGAKADAKPFQRLAHDIRMLTVPIAHP